MAHISDAAQKFADRFRIPVDVAGQIVAEENDRATAWMDIHTLCLSLGMKSADGRGIDVVRRYIENLVAKERVLMAMHEKLGVAWGEDVFARIGELTAAANPKIADAQVTESAAVKESTRLRNGIELAWTIIANASGGDWKKESPEWVKAAEAWRDQNVDTITGMQPPKAPAGDAA